MLAVPKLQSYQVPNDFAVISKVSFAVKSRQAIIELRSKIAPLAGPRISQSILDQRLEPRILQQPHRQRYPEPVLFLVQDFMREDFAHGLFEDISFFKAPKLQVRGNSPGQLYEIMIHQRVTDLNAGELRCSTDLANIVVGKNQFKIEIKEAIELTLRTSFVEMTLNQIEPVRWSNLFEKVWLKDFFWIQAEKKTV